MVPQDLGRDATYEDPAITDAGRAARGLLAARPRPALRRATSPTGSRAAGFEVEVVRDERAARAGGGRAPRAARGRPDPPLPPGTLAGVSTTPVRLHVTRSRANPGGMDVTKVLGTDTEPFRGRKPPWFKVAAARRREVPRADRADPRRGAAHGLPGGRLPERRRVLGARHRDVHDPRRHVHAPLRVLQRQDRQADVERPAGAAARRALGGEDGPAPRGHHVRRPRRPARLRRAGVVRRDPLDPDAGARAARSSA